MTVIDIRGTHGSGKSWCMHQLLDQYEHQPITEEGKHIGYTLPDLEAALVGKYATVTGGCDGVGTADEVVRRVRLFASQYRYVLLEGILVSHSFKRYHELALEVGDYRWLFMSTPLRNCIARVRARRRARGNLKPLSPHNVIKDHVSVWTNIQRKARDAGHRVVVVPWRDPLPTVLHELGVS